MTLDRRRFAQALIAFLGALVCVPDVADAAEPITVRIGIVNASSDVGFFIADKKGYFREEGIKV